MRAYYHFKVEGDGKGNYEAKPRQIQGFAQHIAGVDDSLAGHGNSPYQAIIDCCLQLEQQRQNQLAQGDP